MAVLGVTTTLGYGYPEAPGIFSVAGPASRSEFLERSHVVSLMEELTRRPSELGPLQEAEPAILSFIAEELAPRLAAYGMTDQDFDEAGNLIARSGQGQGGRLLLIINAMTQPAYDMPEPFNPRVLPGSEYGIEGDVMIGRGLSEQKANMTAMLSGIGHAHSQGLLTGELSVVCCPSGETGRHDAIAHALTAFKLEADMAILGGTSLAISLGNRGRIDLALDVRGKTSHASRPHQGANAALAACSAIQNLIENGNGGQEHPVLGKPSLTLTGIRSFPETSHTVQDHCVADLDRRLLPGEDPHEVTDHLRAMLADAEPYLDPFSKKQLTTRINMGAFMYPSLVKASAPIVGTIRKAAVSETGVEPDLIHLPNAFDQGYLNHIGIPAVNFGCGEYAFAHTHDDLASIDRTLAAARIFARLISDICG